MVTRPRCQSIGVKKPHLRETQYKHSTDFMRVFLSLKQPDSLSTSAAPNCPVLQSANTPSSSGRVSDLMRQLCRQSPFCGNTPNGRACYPTFWGLSTSFWLWNWRARPCQESHELGFISGPTSQVNDLTSTLLLLRKIEHESSEKIQETSCRRYK